MSATEFSARHRFAGITARKARRIADLIRGRSVNEALELLQFAPQRGAAFYLKVVRSAVANASLDEDVNINSLVITDCRADDGPLLSGRMRFRPGPQGRAMPFAKRLSHLTVKLTAMGDGATKTPRGKSAGKKSGKKPATAGPVTETTETTGTATAEKPARKKSPGKKKSGEGRQA
jgi:large subunit ribosomal protein L22